MLCAPVVTSASPDAMPSVPSVVTNGGKPSHATSAPFANPNAAPSASAPPSASVSDPVLTATAASTTHASVSTAPMERSMPSVSMISVIGRARSSRIVDCIPMFARFAGSRKPVPLSAKPALSTTSMYAAPGMRPQPKPRRGKASSDIVHGQAQEIGFGQLSACEFTHHTFVTHHVSAIANFDRLGELGADHEHRRAALHQLI